MPNDNLPTTLSTARMNRPRMLMVERFTVLVLPTFAKAEADRIFGDPAAVIHSEDQKAWCTLAGWLDPTTAVVLCRKTGLSVQLKKGRNVTAELLPAGDNSPSADVVYKGQATGLKCQATLDVANGSLTFSLPFADPNAWDPIFSAMVADHSDVALVISWRHRFRVRSPAAPIHEFHIDPEALRRLSRVVTTTTTTAAPVRTISSRLGRILATGAAGTTTPAPAVGGLALNLRALANLRVSRLDMRRIVVDPPREAQPAGGVVDRQVAGPAVRVSLARPRTDSTVFPDLARSAQHGWGQAPRNPRLHFCDSPRSDTFYYAPTGFKLGYYCEPGVDGAGRPPYRVELYRTAEGEDRIKATLVALPCLQDGERQTLRTYIHDDVLQGLEPFVFLEPKSGLEARFVEDFSSGDASSPQTLPASIGFQADEVIPDDRLVLRFDMPATAYAIFCELLKRGVYGRAVLSAEGFQDSVEVRLQLADVVTNGVRVEQRVHAASAPQPDGEEEPGAAIVIRNLLALPVRISSLHTTCLEMGEQSGMVFETEELDLMPGGGSLDASAEVSLEVSPQRLAAWDQTLVEPGQIVVQGGTVEDWLNRVHRDPSMQAQEFRVQAQVSLPSSGRERVQLVRVKLFREGEAAARSRLDFTPEGPAQDLRLVMTFEELASAQPPSFAVEYETLYQDGGISLAQRAKVPFGAQNLLLRALIEPVSASYTVEFDDQRQTLDRAAAAALVEDLRKQNKCWEVFAQEIVTTTTTTTTPAPTTTTTTTTGPQPEVSVITDLLPAAFATGGLRRVFVVLKTVSNPPVQSTYAFDVASPQGITWRPQGAVVPPFRYEVTYLYENGQSREADGEETNLVLILDPPRLA